MNIARNQRWPLLKCRFKPVAVKRAKLRFPLQVALEAENKVSPDVSQLPCAGWYSGNRE
jgi:hypothetical protein